MYGAQLNSRFIEHNAKTGVIIRERLQHEGHDLNDMEERRVARLDAELVIHIESLLEQVGYSSMYVIRELDLNSKKVRHLIATS